MASIRDRLGRLEGKRNPSTVPARSPYDLALLKHLNVERWKLDRADAEALGNPADFDFGDGPREPEPLTPEEEALLERDDRESTGDDWVLSMLAELRETEGDDVSQEKQEGMDQAIDTERDRLQKGEAHEE